MRRITVLVAVGLLIAACSASSEITSSDDGRPESFDDLAFESPLFDFLGFDVGANDAMEAEFADMQRRAEQLTAECMLEKGFQYVPADRGSVVAFRPGGDDLAPWSDEWVEKYGFGISTQRFPESELDPGLVGFPDEDRMVDEAFEDPNQAYLDSLSEGEREAYFSALYGAPPDLGPGEVPDEDFFFEPSGCQNEAFQAIFDDGPGANMNEFFEAFGDELQALEERARSDPRAVEYYDRVSDCMAEAGFTYTTEEDVYRQFDSRLNGIGQQFGREDPFEAAGLDPENMSQREIEDFFRELNRLSPEDQQRLAAIQAEEIEMAKAAVSCDGGPLNEQWFLGELRVEYEQQFIDANRSELEQYRSAD